MAADGYPSNAFKLLQPELLSKEELTEILLSRCVSKETVRDMTKEMLLELYRRVVLPLPQRERSNRKKNSGVVFKTRVVAPPDNIANGQGFTIGFNGSVKRNIAELATSVSRSNKITNDRLKPPPEFQSSVKKLRLSSSKSDLDNIIIKDRRKSQDGEGKMLSSPVSETKSMYKIGNNKEQITPDNDLRNNAAEPKRVALKRNFSTVQASSPLKTETEEVSREKKQRAKITWP